MGSGFSSAVVVVVVASGVGTVAVVVVAVVAVVVPASDGVLVVLDVCSGGCCNGPVSVVAGVTGGVRLWAVDSGCRGRWLILLASSNTTGVPGPVAVPNNSVDTDAGSTPGALIVGVSKICRYG